MRILLAIRYAAAVLWLALLASSALFAQVDREWLRTWREAQRHKPAVVGSVERIAPAGEPGTPLVVEGRVFLADGTTPAAAVVVFAYHTDRNGLYAGPAQPGVPWRLKGWAVTDAEGRFEFHTIRPAPYPNRSVPAHIHLTVESPVHGRQWAPELLFADDPLVPAKERRQSEAAGRFAHVCRAQADPNSGVIRVQFLIRLKPKADF